MPVTHAQSMLELAQSALPADFPVTSTVVDGPSVESAINKLDWHDGDVIMVGSSRLGPAAPTVPRVHRAKMLRVFRCR